MQKRPNLTGAVKKIQKHYAQRGQRVSVLVTGTLQDDFAEVILNGESRWVKLNGRGPLQIRTNL